VLVAHIVCREEEEEEEEMVVAVVMVGDDCASDIGLKVGMVAMLVDCRLDPMRASWEVDEGAWEIVDIVGIVMEVKAQEISSWTVEKETSSKKNEKDKECGMKKRTYTVVLSMTEARLYWEWKPK